MDPKLTKIFCDFQVEPRPQLCSDICRHITVREHRIHRIKVAGYSISGIIVIGTTILLIL